MSNSIPPVSNISMPQLIQETVKVVSNTHTKGDNTEVTNVEHTLELYNAGGKLYTVYKTNLIDYSV